MFNKIISVLTQKEKQKFKILILLNTIISITDIALLALLVYTINIYTYGTNALKITWIPGYMYEGQSLLLIGLVFVLFIIKNSTAYIVYSWQSRFIYGVAARLSHDNLIKYLSGDYMDYVDTDAAVHIRKIGQQPIEFCHYILEGLQQIITEFVLIIFSITAILLFNAKLFFIISLILFPPVLLISYQSKRRLRSVRKDIQSSGETSLQYLNEAISGYIESSIYGSKKYFADRYSKYQSRLNDHVAQLQIVQNLPSRILEIFAVSGLFVLILINKKISNNALLDITTISAFTAAAYKIIPGIVKIFNLTGHMKTFEFTLHDQLKQLIKNEIVNEEKPHKISSVSFDSVSFHYNEQAYLENFCLSASSNEIVGIAGKSGKGKTTAIHLLLGFLAQQKGSILFNGKPVNDTERKTYWKNIAYVKQQTFLLHDTILSNIILDDLKYNEERLQWAVKLAGIDKVISNYEEGLHKIITENGKNISGGQRQRIAIARALYRNADLYIFDEPFSMLDDISMVEIMEQLNTIARSGKIVLLISHNEKSLSFCNKIIWLNE